MEQVKKLLQFDIVKSENDGSISFQLKEPVVIYQKNHEIKNNFMTSIGSQIIQTDKKIIESNNIYLNANQIL